MDPPGAFVFHRDLCESDIGSTGVTPWSRVISKEDGESLGVLCPSARGNGFPLTPGSPATRVMGAGLTVSGGSCAGEIAEPSCRPRGSPDSVGAVEASPRPPTRDIVHYGDGLLALSPPGPAGPGRAAWGVCCGREPRARACYRGLQPEYLDGPKDGGGDPAQRGVTPPSTGDRTFHAPASKSSGRMILPDWAEAQEDGGGRLGPAFPHRGNLLGLQSR